MSIGNRLIASDVSARACPTLGRVVLVTICGFKLTSWRAYISILKLCLIKNKNDTMDCRRPDHRDTEAWHREAPSTWCRQCGIKSGLFGPLVVLMLSSSSLCPRCRSGRRWRGVATAADQHIPNGSVRKCNVECRGCRDGNSVEMP